MTLRDDRVLEYSCCRLSSPECALSSVFCIHPNTNAPCQCSVRTNKLVRTVREEACLGPVILKLKHVSLFSLSSRNERERECERVTWRGEETLSERCDFHSRGIKQSLLSIPLNQETSGRKGRRIRLAGEQGERKREWAL